MDYADKLAAEAFPPNIPAGHYHDANIESRVKCAAAIRKFAEDACKGCDNERAFAEKSAYTSSWKEACDAVKWRIRALMERS